MFFEITALSFGVTLDDVDMKKRKLCLLYISLVGSTFLM